MDLLASPRRRANPRARKAAIPDPPRAVAVDPPAEIAVALPAAVAAARKLAGGVKKELDRVRREAGLPASEPYRFDHVNAVLNDAYAAVKGRAEIGVSSRDLRDAFERRSPWPVLGWGNFRVALRATADFVVKLPITPLSGDDNGREAALWRDAPTPLATHLAPVYAADPAGGWLVMQYAESLGYDDEENRAYWAAVGVVEAAGVDDLEDTVQNWGRYDGRYVARDYGAGLAPKRRKRRR